MSGGDVSEFGGCAGVIAVALVVVCVVWYAASHGLSVWPLG